MDVRKISSGRLIVVDTQDQLSSLKILPFKLPIDGKQLSVGRFELKPGSVTLLNGASDAPIQELLLAIAGLRTALQHRLRPTGQGLKSQPVDVEPFLQGKVTLNGEDVLGMNPAVRAKQIALIFENPEWGFVCSTVEEDFRYSFGACGLEAPPPYTLRRYGLLEARSLAPELLSGGEQQRLACAAVIERSPAVVLADFSSSNLDRHFQEEILKRWMERSRDDGTIFVVRGMPTQALGLVDGVLEVTKSTAKYRVCPNGYTAPQSDDIKRLLSAALAHRGPQSTNQHVIVANEFRHPYSKGLLTLKATAREVKLLVGPNGAGKTTFGRAVVEHGRSSKYIEFADDVVPSMSLQNTERSLFSRTILNELRGDKNLLKLCGIDSKFWHKPPLTLPRANQRLLSIAAALQRASQLAILDEPTLGLDPRDFRLFAKLIEEFAHLSIIMMTHDPILIEAASEVGVEIVDLEIVR